MRPLLISLALLVLLPVVLAQDSTCVDDEGKLDAFVKGTVDLGRIGSYPDFCKTEERLFDYYCDEGGELAYEVFDCEAGCLDGACQGAPEAEVQEPAEPIEEAPVQVPVAPAEVTGNGRQTAYWVVGLIVVLAAIAWVVWKKKK